MECISNFKAAFLTKVEYKENFRNKISKQYIKGAFVTNTQKKTQNKKDNTYGK